MQRFFIISEISQHQIYSSLISFAGQQVKVISDEFV